MARGLFYMGVKTRGKGELTADLGVIDERIVFIAASVILILQEGAADRYGVPYGGERLGGDNQVMIVFAGGSCAVLKVHPVHLHDVLGNLDDFAPDDDFL